MLLEVLIALLIFAVGVLGIVGLQASMTRAQSASKFRGDAAYLAQEFVGTMWSDTTNLAQYTDTACGDNPRCAAIKAKVANQLPAGTVAFAIDSVGVFTITIGWTVPGEDPNKFAMATAIKR